MKKVNIIQFTPYFPPHKWWLEKVWEEIWKYWSKKKLWNFINVTTDFNQDIYLNDKNLEKIIFRNETIWYIKDWYEVLVIPSFEIVYNFPVFKTWDRKYKIITKYLESKVKDDTNYRVITHTRFFITNMFWWFFAKNNKLKWIHIEHWSWHAKLKSKFKSFISFVYDNILWKWVFKKADKILAISDACKKFIISLIKDKQVDVFYRWLEFDNIVMNKKGEVKIVFVGRLVSLKWVRDLISAYQISWINNKLVIIWDGEDMSLLKEKAKWLNIDFKWFKDNKWIMDYLSENNCILVNPSYQEWLPTTIIEWLFTLNLVVASDVWWTSEISDDEDLILFNPWEIEELKNKLLFWISNYYSLIWKSKNTINNKFDRNKNILNLYKLLK